MIYDFVTPYGKRLKVSISRNKYAKGGIALEMIDESDGTRHAVCTVWIPGLREDEVAVKDYSENAGVLDFLVKNLFVEKPHRTEQSGFVTLHICKIID